MKMGTATYAPKSKARSVMSFKVTNKSMGGTSQINPKVKTGSMSSHKY